MNILLSPAEVISAQLFTGPGSAPMLAAAAAWDGLAGELGSAASSFGSVTSGLTAQAWQGPASAAMAAAAAPYTGLLNPAAVQAQGAAGSARAVASAFEAAWAATVPPMLVQLNRNSLVQMVLSNWFGLHAPAIAQLESEYEQMWAQDVAAMVGYHGAASSAASQLTSWWASLQGLASQVAGAPAVAARAPAMGLTINLGVGNNGNLNLGSGNTGSYNFGNGNSGSFNFGGGNLGSNNFGKGNLGSGNFGSGNFGSGNIGSGNGGPIGPNGPLPGNNNVGMGNSGNNNFGFGNSGNGNIGGGTAATTISAWDFPAAMR